MRQNNALGRAIADATAFIRTNTPDQTITIGAIENELLSKDQYQEVIGVHQQPLFLKGLRRAIRQYLKTLQNPETLAPEQTVFPGLAPPLYIVNKVGNEFIYIPLHQVNRRQWVKGMHLQKVNIEQSQVAYDDRDRKLMFGDYHANWDSNEDLTWGEIENIVRRSLPPNDLT